MHPTVRILLFVWAALMANAFLLAESPPIGQPTPEAIANAQVIRESLVEQYQLLWSSMSDDAKAGYHNLVNNVYLPADFDEDVLNELDKTKHNWDLVDAPLGDNLRENTWLSYGLAPRPDDPKRPLQYVVTNEKEYVMNCFACHGGNLYGTTYPGAANTTYALETLIEQVRRIKVSLNKPLTHMDVGSVFMPLGKTVGSSNAVMFGVALMNYRDSDLNVHINRVPPSMVHHDMDAPAWWHFHRKHHIYIDGFAEKGHRGLMQFMLVRQNGPEKFKAWENDFRQVYAYISALRPPKYPLPIEAAKANRGKLVFNNNCASCHGTYGEDSDYPELRVPIEDVDTDRVRLDALTPANRKHYGDSWFAHFGEQENIANVDGYVAPPLDGIWASAPYLHNGSVPTLWHMLHPSERPQLWKRTALGLDTDKMGLQIESSMALPRKLKPAAHRWYFDTTQFGKSAKGHDYPNKLSEEEKCDLLEYLKTL